MVKRPDDKTPQARTNPLLALLLFAFGGTVLFQRFGDHSMIRSASAMILIALLQVRPLGAQTTSPDIPRMQAVVQTFVRDSAFMGSILVAKNGKVLLDQGYGSADLEWSIPNDPSSKFRIASITKQFTAACILLLEERGQLRIDDPINKYLPDDPPEWRGITIYELLTHTSGIANINTFSDYKELSTKNKTPAELVARFSNEPLTFAPGSSYSYGNSDYILLGYLIEKVSGQPYRAFLRKNILDPLGMSETGVDINAELLPHRAHGYTASPSGFQNSEYVNMTVPFSAGNLYSTTHDLFKWETALFTGHVIGAGSLLKMTTPFKNGYALGLLVGTKDGHRVISHTGDIAGFGASVAYYPDDKLTIIVLSNLFGGAYGLVAKDLAKVALGLPVTLNSERTIAVVPADTLAKYVGRYQLTPTIINTITLQGGRLFSQVGNQAVLELVPESQTKFFMKHGDAEIEFLMIPSTRTVDRLVVYQDGASYPGKKLHQ